MFSRQFRKAVRRTLLGAVIALTSVVANAAPPADDSNASERTRRTAKQIREHIGEWLKPNSTFNDLTDDDLLEVFPKMRFPAERAEVIILDRRKNLVLTEPAITVGQGTILAPADGVGNFSVQIIRERADSLVGRIIPAKDAESVRAGTRLRATNRRIKVPTWPPRKVFAFVESANKDHAVFIPGINDYRLKEVLFSVYREDGTRIAVAEILLTGGPDTPIDGSPVSILEATAPLEQWMSVYLVPISSKPAPAEKATQKCKAD